MPFIFATGIAKKSGQFVFEADILYAGWSSMSRYRVSSDMVWQMGFFKKPVQFTQVALGMNYLWGNNMEVRGYMFDRTPIPKKTLSPDLPDSTRHILTAGISYKKSDYKLNIGYQATFFNNTRSYIAGIDGKYTGFAHALMLGIELGRYSGIGYND